MITIMIKPNIARTSPSLAPPARRHATSRRPTRRNCRRQPDTDATTIGAFATQKLPILAAGAYFAAHALFAADFIDATPARREFLVSYLQAQVLAILTCIYVADPVDCAIDESLNSPAAALKIGSASTLGSTHGST
jgi:hypothetical protein